MKLNGDPTSSTPVEPVYKIVVTGGPCGGKTTICRELVPFLEEDGFRVFLVPEAATICFQSGWSADENDTIEGRFAFHKSIIRLQMCLEDRIADLARATGHKSIILCDRGLMDASAYMIAEEWELLLKSMGLNASTILDERYIGVIHFVTAADSTEQYSQNGSHRSESPEYAVTIDRRTQEAWKAHIRRAVIPNEIGGMKMKLEKALDEVRGFLKSVEK
eukprot:419701_1